MLFELCCPSSLRYCVVSDLFVDALFEVQLFQFYNISKKLIKYQKNTGHGPDMGLVYQLLGTLRLLDLHL